MFFLILCGIYVINNAFGELNVDPAGNNSPVYGVFFMKI